MKRKMTEKRRLMEEQFELMNKLNEIIEAYNELKVNYEDALAKNKRLIEELEQYKDEEDYDDYRFDRNGRFYL